VSINLRAEQAVKNPSVQLLQFRVMMRCFCSIWFVFLATLKLLFAQQPGQLDSDFGVDGVVIEEVTTANDQIDKLLVLDDDKLLCLGRIQYGIQIGEIFLTRALPSGDIDETFGEDGMLFIDPTSGIDVGSDMLQLNDGKVLVTGHASPPGDLSPLFVMVNPTGTLDSSFGDNGIIVLDLPQMAIVQKVKQLPNDKLLCAGQYQNDIVVFRLLQDGTLDQTFGNGGLVIIDAGFDYYTCTDMVLGSGSDFFVCGSVGMSVTEGNVFICKLGQDGSFATDFNDNGWLELDIDPAYLINQAGRMSWTSENKLLVSGLLYDSNSGESFLTRIESDGSIDMGFGVNGFFRFDNGSGFDFVFSLLEQPDGKILLGGRTSGDGTVFDSFVLRTSADGMLDPMFGNNGLVVSDLSFGDDVFRHMALQSDGKLVVGGSAEVAGNDDIVLARYHTGLNISVDELSNEKLFSVYPNPTTEIVVLKTDQKLRELELIDGIGRIVLSEKINSLQPMLNVSELAPGIYTLRASDGKRAFSQRVVKE
jgi:uncharacterized delta-60 repeat protein